MGNQPSSRSHSGRVGKKQPIDFSLDIPRGQTYNERVVSSERQLGQSSSSTASSSSAASSPTTFYRPIGAAHLPKSPAIPQFARNPVRPTRQPIKPAAAGSPLSSQSNRSRPHRAPPSRAMPVPNQSKQQAPTRLIVSQENSIRGGRQKLYSYASGLDLLDSAGDEGGP